MRIIRVVNYDENRFYRWALRALVGPMTCPICGSAQDQLSLLDNLPLSSGLLESQPFRLEQTESWRAHVCNHCQHLYNAAASDRTAYHLEDYRVKSQVPGAMTLLMQEIFTSISSLINLDDRVLEIGSGAGQLARAISQLNCQVETVDPSVKDYASANIKHWSSVFDDKFPGHGYQVIIARHVLEHMSDPRAFLQQVVQRLSPNGYVYIEVPSLEATLDHYRLMDFFHDHIHYFSKLSLTLLAAQVGLRLVKTKAWLNGLHIGYTFVLDPMAKPVGTMQRDIISMLETSKVQFQQILEKINRAKPGIVLYGAGAHAATFTSQLTVEQAAKITGVWDRSPDKQGLYLPNISVPVSQPVRPDKNPSLVINSAILYANEVRRYLVDQLSIASDIIDL